MFKVALARVGSGSLFQFLTKSLPTSNTAKGNFEVTSLLLGFRITKPGNFIVRRSFSFSSDLQNSTGNPLNTVKMASQAIGKSLEHVESALNNWLKPQLLGESWDNIGLLVGSGRYEKKDKIIEGIILCNDLTPAVLDEAIAKKADMIIAYHPPIFAGMKSISYGNWKERLIARCLANDISIYSPHTTLDSTIGGINDRVLNALRVGKNAESKLQAITPSKFLDPDSRSICFASSPENISSMLDKIQSQNFKDIMISVEVGVTAVLTVYGKSSLETISKMVSEMGLSNWTGKMQTEKATEPIFGAGRMIELAEEVDLDDAVDMLKTHLGLGYVQLAYGGSPKVKTAAVCVGSGSSLLKPIAGKIDLLVTGEMSHHDILDCVHAGSSVVLCNHCSSERHYLPDLANILQVVTGLTNIFVSEEDASPLRLVL